MQIVGRPLLWLVAVATLLGVFLPFAAPRPAFACSCAGPPSPADLAALGPGVLAQEATPVPAGGPPAIEPQPFPRRMAYVAAALVVAVLSLGGALIVWRMGPGPGDEDEQ